MPLVPNPLRVNIHQALVVLRLDSPILRINHYPVESVIDFHNTYLLIMIYLVNSAIQHLNICSLLSRQLEIVGARKSGRRRRRHARGEGAFPHPSCVSLACTHSNCAHYFQEPATQARISGARSSIPCLSPALIVYSPDLCRI